MRALAAFSVALLSTSLLADPQPSTYQMPMPGASAQVAPAPQPNVIQLNPNLPGAPVNNTAPQNYDAYVPDKEYSAWKHYHWTEAKAMWEGKRALFLDARAKVEYDAGHIPGAIPMPLGEFDKYYALYENRIKHAKHLITYCHGVGCKLSDKVAQKLYVDKGLKNTGAFFGGWPQWQEHKLPVETGGEPKSR